MHTLTSLVTVWAHWRGEAKNRTEASLSPSGQASMICRSGDTDRPLRHGQHKVPEQAVLLV